MGKPSQIQRPLHKWLELYERSIAGWLDIVVACVEDAAAHGPEATVSAIPPQLVLRLREERVIKFPPPLDGIFPIQCAEHLEPNADVRPRERSRCVGATQLHDYFEQTIREA